MRDEIFAWPRLTRAIVKLNSCRGYYQCVHRRDKGCQALKKMQRTDDDPQLFDVVYQGEHTCAESLHPRAESARSLPHHLSVSAGVIPPAMSESQVTYEAVSSGSTAGVRFMSPATSAGSQVTYERGSRSTAADRFMSPGMSESQVTYEELTDAFWSLPDDVDPMPKSPMDKWLDLNADFVDDDSE